MTEKISVLIPMFNREKFIEESINSVRHQNYKNICILVYDDGSEDNSVNLVNTLAKKDKRIKLIVGDENKGVGYARNKLLEHCNTRYACWQDSDDISVNGRLQEQVYQITPKKMVFTKWVWLHEGNGTWVERYKNTNSKAFATLMFPVDKSIKFNDSIKLGGEDWNWIELMQKKYDTCVVPNIFYRVRYHSDRIGNWKRIIRPCISKQLISSMSYAQIINYYKNQK